MSSINVNLEEIGSVMAAQCVLVSVESSAPRRAVTVVRASEKVQAETNSTTARVVDKVLSPSLAKLSKNCREVVHKLLVRTGARFDGRFLVDVTDMPMVKEVFDEALEYLKKAVDEEVGDWDMYKQDVALRMGRNYSPDYLPDSKQGFIDEFTLTLVVRPAPSGDSYLTGGSDTIRDMLKDSIRSGFEEEISGMGEFLMRNVTSALDTAIDYAERREVAANEGKLKASAKALTDAQWKLLVSSAQSQSKYNFVDDPFAEAISNAIIMTLEKVSTNGLSDGSYVPVRSVGAVLGALKKIRTAIENKENSNETE